MICFKGQIFKDFFDQGLHWIKLWFHRLVKKVYSLFSFFWNKMKCEIKYARVRHWYARIWIDWILKITIPRLLRFNENFKNSLIEKWKKLLEKYNKRNLNKILVQDQNYVLLFWERILLENINWELESFLKTRVYEKSFEIIEDYTKKIWKGYQKLTIKKMKSKRWSCSYDDKIVINQKLVHLPLKYLEYVCVHEVCHIKQKNHSDRFWALVEGFLPDFKQTKKELKFMILW